MKETPEQAQDRATRRRWITLAELVGVAGVVIAALTLYLGWADRRVDEAARRAETTNAARERARVDLAATVERSGAALALKDERHDLSDLVVAFPRALDIATQRPAERAIEADWIAAPLLKLTDGGADQRSGRLPVLVTVRYWDGDAARAATGIYDLIWRTEGRVLRSRVLTLEALRLRERGGSQARLDVIWAREKPTL